MHRWSFSRAIAVLGGLSFLAFGMWAMVAPRRFFEAAAAFEPYNQHFVQDIGAFQIGLGVVLVLSVFLARGGALTTGLLGVGVGSAAHVVSHLVGRDLGGTPEVDIPVFAVMTLLLLAGGLDSWRRLPGSRGGETGDVRRYRWPSASRRQAGEAHAPADR
jgi:hypothetical protein